jgi:hypothetical protein
MAALSTVFGGGIFDMGSSTSYDSICLMLNAEDSEERDDLTTKWRDHKIQELNFVGTVVSINIYVFAFFIQGQEHLLTLCRELFWQAASPRRGHGLTSSTTVAPSPGPSARAGTAASSSPSSPSWWPVSRA